MTTWLEDAAFLVLALSAAAGFVTTQRVTRPGDRALAAQALALFVGTLALHLWLADPRYFLHTGRGPSFVCLALGGRVGTYDPGLHGLYGPLLRAFPSDPDGALFAVHRVFVASVPAMWFTAARVAGAPAVASLAAASAFAASPALAALGASESYLASILGLVASATTLTTVAAVRAPTQRGRRLGFVAAGALLAHATSVHPAAYPPVLLVPWLVAALPTVAASARRRVTAEALVAQLGLVVVAVASARFGRVEPPTQVGRMWFALLFERGLVLVPLGFAACVYLVIRRVVPEPARAPRFVAVVSLAAACAYPVVGLLDLPPAGLFAYAALGASPGVVACLAQRGVVGRRAIVGPLVVWAALAAATLPSLRPTTEQAEAAFLRAERARLPADAVVGFVRVVGGAELELPLFGGCGVRGPSAVSIEPGGPVPPMTHYLHSSLCSTEAAQAACAEVERGFRGTRMTATRLPAASTKVRIEARRGRWPHVEPFRYTADPVEVVLYRVDGAPSRTSRE